MSVSDNILRLKSYLLNLVPDLDDDTWNAFVDKTTFRNYKKGEYLYQPGSVCKYISFVCSGLIRSYYTVDGKDVITAFVCEDGYFSDYESFLTQRPTQMYSQALEDTTVINVSYTDLNALYAQYPKCQQVGRLIAESLFIILSNRTSSFQFDTPETRYNLFLSAYEPILQRIPQYMIASYIGCTPEALSRIRSRLTR